MSEPHINKCQSKEIEHLKELCDHLRTKLDRAEKALRDIIKNYEVIGKHISSMSTTCHIAKEALGANRVE